MRKDIELKTDMSKISLSKEKDRLLVVSLTSELVITACFFFPLKV